MKIRKSITAFKLTQRYTPVTPRASPRLAGRLIGVNTIAYFEESQAALRIAISVDLVKRIVPTLISNGRIPTAGIGIVLDKESAARGRQLKGVLVGRTKPGSPAERAGLQGSDASNGGLGV